MSIFEQMTVKIIREQELVIGPLAWLEAGKVSGLQIVDQKKAEVILNDDQKSVVDRLVNRYENIFGRASKEVCKEAAAALIADLPKEEIPSSLQ